MARLRYNGLAASLAAALGTGTTTATFASALTYNGGTTLPTITAPDVLPLAILDGSNVTKEIVYLTAYTSGATTGTITRAQEGTTAAAHDTGRIVLGAPTLQDFTGRDINAQTGTSYTLTLKDAGGYVTMSNAAASTLTVPPNSSVAFPVGTIIDGAQLGAGQVTLTPGSGVTINGTPGLKVSAQYGGFRLIKRGTDTWLATGNLAA